MARNHFGHNIKNQPQVFGTPENSITANTDISNLMISESAYTTREILRGLAVKDLNSDLTGTDSHISNVLRSTHAGRLLNVLPLHVFYPDLILEKSYGAAVFGLGTSGKDMSCLPAQQRNFSKNYIKINLSLPDTNQQINLNVILVEHLDQFILENGAQYLNLQERIGNDFYKLPSQMLIAEEGVLPVRIIMPTFEQNRIWVQHQFLPAKLLYNKNFYNEAHHAGLYSGTEATNFCYNYIGLKSPITKIDNVISGGGGGEDFAHKVKTQKFTNTHPHPSNPNTE